MARRKDHILRPITVSTRSEDQELTKRDRQAIISGSRDMIRNFTLAGFVLRKHLQSIAYYQFRAKTHDATFNAALEARVRRWQRRDQCDAARRHGFEELTNLLELHRALDGDVGLLLLRDNSIQIIESDRICNCTGQEYGSEWVHGVRLGARGQALEYQIARRNESGILVPDRRVPARFMKMIGYYSRNDQVRGVSLMAPACRFFQYLYEEWDLAHAKQKLIQMMGLVTTFERNDGIGYTEETQTQEERENEIEQQVREILPGGGILRLNMRSGEEVKILESSHPGTNFLDFTESTIRQIFAAFDIPYSFFDGSKTNYYGAEGEFEQYIDSIEKKQAGTIEALNEIAFEGLIPNWLMNNEIQLPTGMTLDDLMETCSWHGAGLPSWRMYRNIGEILLSIQAGIISPSEAASDYGFDIRENLRDRSQLEEYARSLGTSLPYVSTSNNIGL